MDDIKLMVFRVTTQDTDEQRRIAEGAAQDLKARLISLLHTNDIQVSVDYDLLLTSESSAHPNYCARSVSDYADNNPDKEWTHYHLLGGRSPRPGQGGHGMPGKSVVYDGSVHKPNLNAHEVIAHNLGLRHMGAYQINGRISEYGGYGCTALEDTLPGSMGYLWLGLIDDEHVAYIQQGESLDTVLYPVESSKEEIGPDHKRLVVLYGDDGNRYYLSFRRWGSEFGRSKSTNLYVETYLGPDSAEGGKTRWVHLDPIRLGDTVQLGGFYITYSEFNAERAIISVSSNSSASTFSPELEEFYFPEETEEVTQEDTGLWYSPYFNGQGFEFFFSEDMCCGGWYSYKGGQSRWFTMQGPVEEGKASLDVYTSDSSSLIHVGKAQLNKKEGRLYLQVLSNKHGRFALALERIGPKPGGEVTGWWYNVDRDYRGLKVHQLSDTRAIAYWYGYGEPIPPVAGMPPDVMSSQRWYYYDLEKQGPRFAGKKYHVTGGSHLFNTKVNVEEINDACYIELEDGRLTYFDGDTTQILDRLF